MNVIDTGKLSRYYLKDGAASSVCEKFEQTFRSKLHVLSASIDFDKYQ